MKLHDPAFTMAGWFPGQEVHAGYITMEAIGLITWSPWLRPVLAVGSGA